MPGVYCKAVVNGGYAGFSHALAENLKRAQDTGAMTAKEAHEKFDIMVKIELEAYKKMRDLVAVPMQDKGLLSPDIWEMYAG